MILSVKKSICIVNVLILMLIMTVLLPCIDLTCHADSEEVPAVKVRVLKDDEHSRLNGKYIGFDISCDEFLSIFSYNDIVTVEVNGLKYDVPVCSSMPNAEFSTNAILIDYRDKYLFGTDFDRIYLTSSVRSLGIESGIFKKNDTNAPGWYIFSGDPETEMWAEIKLKEKNGFGDCETVGNFTRTLNREDYPDLTDEEFANFRMVTAGRIKEGILYRSSSPVNRWLGRNTYADEAARAHGIRTVLNFADSKDRAEYNIGYSDTYYSGCDIYFGDMTLDFSSQDFRDSLSGGLHFMCEHEGPYLIHCMEGKYRTGVTSALIESLMGADIDEIKDDFTMTFKNFYDVQNGMQQPFSDEIAASIGRLASNYLCELFKVDSLDGLDLEAEAENYIRSLGFTDEEIAAIKYNLSGTDAEEEAATSETYAETTTASTAVATATTAKNASALDSPKTGDRGSVSVIPAGLALFAQLMLIKRKRR